MNDLFADGPPLAEKVYILGSGPRGSEHHKRIPADACVIALNKAVLIRRPALWLTWARAYIGEAWFIDTLRSDISKGIACILQMGLEPDAVAEPAWTFEYLPHWFQPPVRQMMPGRLRTGGTIAGAALQLCYWRKVQRVVFCGVDMLGHDYYDGSKNTSLPGGPDRKVAADGADLPWTDLRPLNEMIRQCQNAGMRISSLSETAMALP